MDCEYASVAIRISERITVSQIGGAKAERLEPEKMPALLA
jgi:hypothetical protein